MPKGIKGFQKGNHPKTEFKKGQHPSPKTEFKKGHKFLKGMTGKKHTEKAKRKMKLAHTGKSKPWKGKERPELRKKIKSGWKEFRKQLKERIEYKQWRNIIFERDDYTCQLCSLRGMRLEAHHLLSAREYPEFILAEDNGVTLCRQCHNELNGREKLKTP